MRVQFVSSGLGVGGAERFLVRLCPRLQQHGFEVAVLGLRGGAALDELNEAGVAATSVGMTSWHSSLAGIRTASRLVRDFAPTIVQGWMYHGCIAASFLRGQARLAWSIRQSSEPHSLTGRSTRLAHGIARTLSSRADVIVYNSVHARQTHADAGFVDDRALVIRNGVPSLDGGDRAAARVAVGVPLDAFVVGHVARWHPVKDHATMLGAFAMLARTTPKARLLLVGEGMEPSNSALLALIARQGLDGFVYLLGHHRSMETIYASMDVACLSSRSEAFPNVLAEAMSMGVPCVSTAVGDVAGLVGDTGRLVQPGDAEGLAQALLELVQMEPQDRKALGAAAKARVLKDYGIDAVAQDYVRLYRQLEAA